MTWPLKQMEEIGLIIRRMVGRDARCPGIGQLKRCSGISKDLNTDLARMKHCEWGTYTPNKEKGWRSFAPRNWRPTSLDWWLWSTSILLSEMTEMSLLDPDLTHMLVSTNILVSTHILYVHTCTCYTHNLIWKTAHVSKNLKKKKHIFINET